MTFFSHLGTFCKLRKNFIVFFQNLGKNWKKILYSLYLLTQWSPGAQILWACASWCELSEYAIKIKMTYFRARAWRYSSSREKSEAVRPSKNFDDFQKSQIDGECRFLFFRKKSTFWVKIFPTSTDLASLGLLNSILWLDWELEKKKTRGEGKKGKKGKKREKRKKREKSALHILTMNLPRFAR